jgi:hypothetical protein
MPEGRSAFAPTNHAGSHMKNQRDRPASYRTQQAEPLRVPPYADFNGNLQDCHNNLTRVATTAACGKTGTDNVFR